VGLTSSALAFELKHLAAISAALAELVANTDEGAFKAPRRRRATAGAPAAAAAPQSAGKGLGSRPGLKKPSLAWPLRKAAWARWLLPRSGALT